MDNTGYKTERVQECPVGGNNNNSIYFSDASRTIITATDEDNHTHSVSLPASLAHSDDMNDLAVQVLQNAATKRLPTRIMKKNGRYNMNHVHEKRRLLNYVNDMFTTIMRQRWYHTLIIYWLVFLGSWLFFALIWWVIAFTHGDLDVLAAEPEHRNCVDGIHDFVTAILFSIETQQTIGYGTRAVTDDCIISLFVLTLQNLIGNILECTLTGIIFAKLARPFRRANTIMFTKNAVITMLDDKKCLMFRVADMRGSGFLDANIKTLIVKKEKVAVGCRHMDFCTTNLSISPETEDRLERIHIEWPIHVMHYIDEDSPLYDVTPDTLHQQIFEIIVILEGTIESTGMVTQIRTSYIPSEVLWGYQFVPLVSDPKPHGKRYKVDYRLFDKTVPTDVEIT